MAAARRRLPDAMVSGIFTARSAAIIRTPRPTPMLGCTARVLAYLGLVLMENRHALVVDTRLTLATETAERQAALEMVADHPHKHRITLGADKAYDVAEFVADLRAYNVTPHVAQNTTNRRSAIDGRTTRHSGYAVSGQVRK